MELYKYSYYQELTLVKYLSVALVDVEESDSTEVAKCIHSSRSAGPVSFLQQLSRLPLSHSHACTGRRTSLNLSVEI